MFCGQTHEFTFLNRNFSPINIELTIGKLKVRRRRGTPRTSTKASLVMRIGLDEAKKTEEPQKIWILDDGAKQQQVTGTQVE